MAAPSAAEPPRYLPFDGRPHRPRMGLRPLRGDAWLEVDRHHAADVAAKSSLFAEAPGQVLAVVDDPDGAVRAASDELLERVQEHLRRWHPDLSTATPAGVHPVEAAGRLTQEDWCVHLPDEQGRWRLVAASVCFPTRWDLRHKIGRTLRQIHEPVPGYEQVLAAPVDAFFDRLGADGGVWRLNWNLLDDPLLHQPGAGPAAHPPRPLPSVGSVGEQVWLRVERQTLVRLPRSGAVVFGIRVHVDPLGSIGDAAALERLRATLEQLPEDVLVDKGLVELAPVLVQWADEAAARLGSG